MEDGTISKTSGGEFILHQLLKFVANPDYTSGVISAICDGATTLQMNNLVNVVNELKRKLDLIEKQTGCDIYCSSPVFTDDILPVLQKAKDEVNNKKRRLYVTFMVACIHPDSLNCKNKTIYLKLLDQLDYLSIYILNILNNYRTEKQLIEIIGANYDKDAILVHLYTLKSLDLVDKISAEEFVAMHKHRGSIGIRNRGNVFLYKRSYLGDQFMDFIIKGVPE